MSKFENHEICETYVDQFYMFLYCFLLLELFFRQTSFELEMEKKRKFLEFAKEYYERHNFYYDEEHIEELFYVDVKKDFSDALHYQYYKYEDNPYFEDLIDKAWDLILEEPA